MRRFIAPFLVGVLLLGLGALAVMARGGAATPVAADAADTSFAVASAPQAPVEQAGTTGVAVARPAAPAVLGSTKFNAIAMPLDASASIAPFTASGLATYHGSSVKQVLRWNASLQTFDSFVPGVSPPFLDFPLAVAGSYFLELDSTSSSVFSIVGDVPAQGSVQFTLVKGSSAVDCKFNSITLPLDKSSITTASGLASNVGGVLQVLRWNAGLQTFDSFVPGVSPPFLDFPVSIGYPYFICVNSAGPASWP